MSVLLKRDLHCGMAEESKLPARQARRKCGKGLEPPHSMWDLSPAGWRKQNCILHACMYLYCKHSVPAIPCVVEGGDLQETMLTGYDGTHIPFQAILDT